MSEKPLSILVLDDEESIRWVIGKALNQPEYRLQFASDAESAAQVLERNPVDFALVDINLPGDDGLSFLAKQKKLRPGLLMAVITGEGTMHNAVTAMRVGAFDYLTKPFDINELEDLVSRAAQTIKKSKTHRVSAVSPARAEKSSDMILGKSRTIREIYKGIGRVAATDLTVLILGESGTGKELIAKAIHQHSGRENLPFVAVNCAAIPKDLLEAELFGHEKGAFTGATERKAGRMEHAGKGTVFLDEIGDMPLDLQAKLLRVLQEKEFQRVGGVNTLTLEARIVTATNQSLEKAVEEGRFRADLYYRINGFTLVSAPLRERPEDIPLLVEHFLALVSETLGIPGQMVSPEAMEYLERFPWPGNVRELENVIKSLMITSRGTVIDVMDLPRNITGNTPAGVLENNFEEAVLKHWQPLVRRYSANDEAGLLHVVMNQTERPLIKQVLHETGWNQVRTAKILGINRNTLRTRMQALGIEKQKQTTPPQGAGNSTQSD